jgi:hypothetical protein
VEKIHSNPQRRNVLLETIAGGFLLVVNLAFGVFFILCPLLTAGRGKGDPVERNTI